MPAGPEIEGPFSKPYELWRVDANKVRVERLAEGNTREDLRHVRRRLDWYYQIYFNGKPLPQTIPIS